jgi:hypothetical protein
LAQGAEPLIISGRFLHLKVKTLKVLKAENIIVVFLRDIEKKSV